MKEEFVRIAGRFRTMKVLVVGDFILDVYLRGGSTRLSPEAPVPVVTVESKEEIPGGAANTAMNLRSLGAEVTFLSVVGMDENGVKAKSILTEAGIDTRWLIRAMDRATIVKTRVAAGSHILTRFDVGSEDPVNAEIEKALLRYINSYAHTFDALIISDYDKGLITDRVVEALTLARKARNIFVALDSKRLGLFRQLNPSFVKPNYREAIALLGAKEQHKQRVQQVSVLGKDLFEKTNSLLTALTMDNDGALLFEADKLLTHVCTDSIATPNVVGAGDTFVSAFTLSSVSGASPVQAASIACTASSIAVRKSGTACCSLDELRAYYNRTEKQISDFQQLLELCRLYRAEGKKIVFTNGCFDILHSGHVSYLDRARKLGDLLIVGINNDSSIRRLKGAQRPINPLEDRIHVLSGLSAVDHIISFGEESDDTPISLIRIVRPDVFVKGGDYTREKLPEAETVDAVGGEIVFLPLVQDHSTTNIIQQINRNGMAVAS
jgi:D-beta-D-heptose 7-phosphate kinase / D-beta-D-heptose 1-phosphate adenosyltransferase